MIPQRRADGTLNYDVQTSPNGASNLKPGSESQNRMLAEITPDSRLPKVGAPYAGEAPTAGIAPFSCTALIAGAAFVVGAVLTAAGCILAKSGSQGHESV